MNGYINRLGKGRMVRLRSLLFTLFSLLLTLCHICDVFFFRLQNNNVEFFFFCGRGVGTGHGAMV